MLFKQTNRSGADAVFVSVRNITGAALSAGVPVEWDAVSVTDGNSVTQAKSAASSFAGLFAGITDSALADSAYGLVQVYGFRTSAYVSGHTATASAPGTFLVPSGAKLATAALSAAVASGQNFCSLMETVSTSAVANRNIFIRAM